MKNRVNITIDNKLVQEAKRYAARRKISLSQLIEDYLRHLTSRKVHKKNILDLINELPKAKTIQNTSSERYYEERKRKYGF